MNIVETFFLKIVSMSLGASLVVAVVLILRLFMKPLPKIYSYCLWFIVFLRFLCPFTIQSALALIPVKTDAIIYKGIVAPTPYVNTGIRPLDSAVVQSLSENSAPVPYASADPMQVYIALGAFVWSTVVILALSYAVFSFFRLKMKLQTATLVSPGIYETHRIRSPFLLGILRPRIYLPLGQSHVERDYVIRHELAHLKRKDHLVKPLAFFAVALHWFNPLAWLSFYLMTKDMEMAVDEKVMQSATEDIRGEYSNSLLSLSMKQSGLLVPLAFGESNTKARIKNILSFRKPSGWICAMATVLILAAAVTLLTTSMGDTRDEKKEANHSQTQTLADEEARLAFLSENRTPYIGNNSRVIDLVWSLPEPDPLLTYESISLKTDAEPYGLTVYYTLKPGKTYTDLGSKADSVLFSNAAFLFATIENMDSCCFQINYEDTSSSIVYERERMEELFEGPLYPRSETPEKLAAVHSKIKDYLDFLSDIKSSMPENDNFMERLQSVSVEDLKAGKTTDEAGWETGISLLAELPAEDIRVYGYNGDDYPGRGVIIEKDKTLSCFDISYHDPEDFPPRLYSHDYDKDGSKELAMAIYYGGGTGVSVEQLFVFEKETDGTLVAHSFSDIDYVSKIKARISYQVAEDGNTITLFDGDKKLQTGDLSWLKKEDGKVNDICYGDIVHFEIGKNLNLHIAPGLQVGDWASPQYEGLEELIASVVYHSDGSFSIENIR